MTAPAPSDPAAGPSPAERADGHRAGHLLYSTGRPFWLLLRRVAIIAGCGHVAFLGLFYTLGLTALAWFNAGSVALFAACWWQLGRSPKASVAWLIGGEILAHAGLAVLALGLDSGFQYHVLLIFTPLAIGMTGSAASKCLRLAAVGSYYAVLDAFMRRTLPLYAIDTGTLDALRYFNLAVMLVSMAFISFTYARLVKQAANALRTLATTDPLTGLHNRRRMLDIAREQQARANVAAGRLCVLLCDIDHFKRINDEHGHETGDRALQQVSALLAASLRQQDAVARWGGEEFLVLVTDNDIDGAVRAAERIREAIGATPAVLRDTSGTTKSIAITLTIGVASLGADESIHAAIARADEALYRGKAGGRDRVVVWSPEPSEAAAQPPRARPTGP